MKTFLSIPLIITLLFTGISVRFATHYCCGNVVATRVSLSGDMASCGMESSQDRSSSELLYNSHCCENTSSAYSICSNYFPSSYSCDNICPKVNKALSIHSAIIPLREIFVNKPISGPKPPGQNFADDVSLSAICLLRI